MVKKSGIILMTVLLGVFLSQLMVTASVTFSDLQQSHWAYEPVMKLVEEGTIKGFEDGEFKPDNTVSRAEFVKMIGQGKVRREKDFNDVDTSHWGYEYIMSSGLKGDDNNNFNPDVPITRFDVLQLVWERAGDKKGILAPKIITGQGSNKDAVAWGYAYGLMKGDDGLHLRLNDVLSRAEAAALIVRARAINDNSPQLNFVDTVQPELLEKVFKSVKLFDNMSYDPAGTITNGQMAKAAIRLGTEEYTVSYRGLQTAEPFQHPYVKDLYVVGNDLLGPNNVNEAFIDQKATIKNVLAAFAYYMISKSSEPPAFGAVGDYYKDIQKVDNDTLNLCLTFAYQNGIQLYADGKINPESAVTLKDIAAIVLQLDSSIGTQSGFVIDSSKTSAVQQDVGLEDDLSRYPQNSDSYQCILKGMPAQVYQTPFTEVDDSILRDPKGAYDFAREYGSIFMTTLYNFNNNIKQKNSVKAAITYYPALVCDNGNGYTFRVKVEIIDAPSELRVKDVFNGGSKVDESQNIHNGMVFYGDIVTGQPVTDLNLPADKASLDQIIVIEK